MADRDEDEPLDNVRSALCASIDHAGYQRVSASVLVRSSRSCSLGARQAVRCWSIRATIPSTTATPLPGQLGAYPATSAMIYPTLARASEGGGGTPDRNQDGICPSDYQSAIDEEKVLRRVAAGKNCTCHHRHLPHFRVGVPRPPPPHLPFRLSSKVIRPSINSIAIAERSSGPALLRDLNDYNERGCYVSGHRHNAGAIAPTTTPVRCDST